MSLSLILICSLTAFAVRGDSGNFVKQQPNQILEAFRMLRCTDVFDSPVSIAIENGKAIRISRMIGSKSEEVELARVILSRRARDDFAELRISKAVHSRRTDGPTEEAGAAIQYIMSHYKKMVRFVLTTELSGKMLRCSAVPEPFVSDVKVYLIVERSAGGALQVREEEF